MLAGVALLTVMAGSGLVVEHGFHQVSVLKWVLTLVAPVLLGTLIVARRPAVVASGLMILSLPFEPFVATVHGQPVSVDILTVGLAGSITFFHTCRTGPRCATPSSMVIVAPLLIPLLALTVFLGEHVLSTIIYYVFIAAVILVVRATVSIHPQARSTLALVYVVMASAQGLLAIVQHLTGKAISLYGGAGSTTYSAQTYFFNYGTTARTTGVFFDPISLGNVLATAVPLSMVFAFSGRWRGGTRWLAGGCLVLLGGGLAVSLSRASWIAAVVGLLVAAAVAAPDVRRRIGAASVVVVVVAVAVAFELEGQTIVERFSSIFDPTAATVRTSGGDRLRELDWRAAFRVFTAHPLIGVGEGHLINDVSHRLPAGFLASGVNVQNFYLEYLGRGGSLGGLALLGFLAAVFRDVIERLRTDVLAPALFGSIVAILITWVTDVTANYSAVAGCLAVIVGLSIGRRAHAPDRDPSEQSVR